MPNFKTTARPAASAGKNGGDVAVEITVFRSETATPDQFVPVGSFSLHFLSTVSDTAIEAEIERRISEFIRAIDRDQRDGRSAALAAVFDGKPHLP
jgi:hypothetical protein